MVGRRSGTAKDIRFNKAAGVGGVEIDVLYDDSDREWEPDAAVVLLSAPAVASDGGGDSAPSGSADAGGRSVPGAHMSVERAPFMKTGASGVQCTVLSHFKCDGCGEPEILYATGLGVHFMGVSQRTVREEMLSTGEVRIVTQHAYSNGATSRGWQWLDRQALVARFTDFRFSSSSPHWVLDLSPVRIICELPNGWVVASRALTGVWHTETTAHLRVSAPACGVRGERARAPGRAVAHFDLLTDSLPQPASFCVCVPSMLSGPAACERKKESGRRQAVRCG